MKTIGQTVYEYYYPKYVQVVPLDRRTFATESDILTVPNPAHHAPYELLTKEAREYWEKYAIGHHAVSKNKG